MLEWANVNWLTMWKGGDYGSFKYHLFVNLRGRYDARNVSGVGQERGEIYGVDVSNGSVLNASGHYGIIRAWVCKESGVADVVRVTKGDVDVCSRPPNWSRGVGNVRHENSKRRENIWRGRERERERERDKERERERKRGEGGSISTSDNRLICSHISHKTAAKWQRCHTCISAH